MSSSKRFARSQAHLTFVLALMRPRFSTASDLEGRVVVGKSRWIRLERAAPDTINTQ